MIRVLIIALIVLLILIISLGYIEIKFDLSYTSSKADFKVYIFKFDITKLIRKNKKDKTNNKELIKTSEEKRGMDFKISFRILREILSRIRVLKHKPKFLIDNRLEFGVEDADTTAILYGYACSIIYYIVGVLSLYTNIEGSKIEITPKYNTTTLKLHFVGILRIKIAQIIYISFLFITLGRKLNGATSNREFNENYS